MMALPRASTDFVFTQHTWIVSYWLAIFLVKPVRETHSRFTDQFTSADSIKSPRRCESPMLP